MNLRKNLRSIFLFIDGRHEEEYVLSDFKRFKSFVRPGGVIMFDDYGDSVHSPGVRLAVDAIVRDNFNEWHAIYLPNITGGPKSNDMSNEFILQRRILPLS